MRKYYSISFFLFSILYLNIQSLMGQNMLVWNLRTPTASTGTEATFNATYYQNLELSTLTRGAGAPAAGGCGYGFVGNFGISADKAAAIANNAYFEFKVQAKDSCLMYLKKIKAIIRIQTYSAKSYQWMYSIDGLNFVDIGSPITPDVSEIDVNNGVMQPDIDLSGISALQELSSLSRVTFRLYAWGGSTPGVLNPTWFNFGLGKTTTTIPSLTIEGYSVKNDKTLAWNFYGSDGKATSFYSTSKNNNLEISNLIRGAGSPGINGNSNGFTAALTVSTTAEEAETNQTYFEFNVKPKSGITASLSNISINIRTQTYSAKTYQWKYSLNGALFVNIGSAVTVPVEEVNGGNGVIQPLIDLTGITYLQNIPSTSTVVFRLYAWGGSTPAVDALDKTNVNFGFGKSTSTVPSLMINGTVSGESQSMNKIITAWEFSTIGNTSSLNPSPVTGSFNATTLNANINTGVLSRGSGINSAVGLYYSYAGASVLLSTTKEEAVINNEYFQVVLSPKSQCKLSVAGLKFKYRTTSTGHKNYCWKYSTDGTNFTEFANGVFTSTDTYGEIQQPVDVSAISSLQNIESNVTFRIYVWGATSTAAANAIGRFAAGDASNSLIIYGKTIDLSTFNIANTVNSSTLESCPTCDVTVSSVGELNIDATKTFNSVTVAVGGKLTNIQGSVLAANTLNLNSDATGTATFIDNGTSNITTATVQQYLTTGRNWYVSIPVSTAASSTLSSASSVVCWDETIGDWAAPTLATLNPARGYISVNTTATGTVAFNGTLNNGEKYVDLTRTTGQAKEGFNLVGNPYPSYLDWKKVYDYTPDAGTTYPNRTIMPTPTMWYKTKTTSYIFWTVNGSSGVGTPVEASQNIPPMQAFWVRANPGGGRLTFDNTMRSHGSGSNLLKAPAASIDQQKLLRLQVSNGTNTDEAVVYFNTNASNGFDAYDSPKMSNANKAIPEIYTLVANEELVINGMNELPLNTEFPLGFRSGELNNYSIKASEIKNFDSNIHIILKDKTENAEQDITDEAGYNFSSDVASTENRFSIILRTTGITTDVSSLDDQTISIFGNSDKRITIRCSSDLIGNGTVSVYDEIGQKLEHKNIAGSTTVLNKTYSSGVYLVCVKANGKTKTQRVVIN